MKKYISPVVEILILSQSEIRTDIIRASNETEPDPLFLMQTYPSYED